MGRIEVRYRSGRCEFSTSDQGNSYTKVKEFRDHENFAYDRIQAVYHPKTPHIETNYIRKELVHGHKNQPNVEYDSNQVHHYTQTPEITNKYKRKKQDRKHKCCIIL